VAKGNKFLIECHPDDLKFFVDNYKNISESCIKEFDLPIDTTVKLRPNRLAEKGRVRTFLNGEEYGDILIKDKRTKKTAEPTKPDKGLH
jgi:hypothetical protein